MGSRTTVLAAVLTMALGIGQVAGAQANDPPDAMLEPMPPRLSLTDGQVSFWRPGAQDWTQAQLNTPLAPGDALATGSPGTLEVQIGAHAFVRAWGNAQLSLANQEPDLIQFTLTVGSAVVDLRTLEPGQTVEVDTPNAAVTMAQAGYYRVEVAGRALAGRDAPGWPGDGHDGQRPDGDGHAERRGGDRGHGKSAAGRRRRAAARRVGPLERHADRGVRPRGERAPRFSGHVRAERSGRARHLACRPDVRDGLGADERAGRVDAVQHRLVDPRPRLRLDLGGHGALGLGSLSSRALVLRQRVLGVGARPGDPETGLCAGPGGFPRRAEPRRSQRPGRAGSGLGCARLGRAGRAVVGALGRGPRAVLAGLGWPSRREQRGHPPQDGRERAPHQRVPERERASRGRGRRPDALRPRPDRALARPPRGRAADEAGPRCPADLGDPGELRADRDSRHPTARGEPEAARRRPAAHAP